MSGVVSEPDSNCGKFHGEDIRNASTVRSDCVHILIVCGLRSQLEPLHVANHTDFMDGGQTQGGRLPPADFAGAAVGGGATLAEVSNSVAILDYTIETLARVPVAYRGGLGCSNPLPPKFQSFDKVEPDCKLSGKCLVFLFQHPN